MKTKHIILRIEMSLLTIVLWVSYKFTLVLYKVEAPSKTPPYIECPGYDNCQHPWWDYSSGTLGRVKYSFIATAPRSTLTQNKDTSLGFLYRSNRSTRKLFKWDTNTWNHMTVYKQIILLFWNSYLQTYNCI